GMNFLNPTTFVPYWSPSRFIMGGGGGAGTNNNSSGTPAGGFASSGASGGGIIIVNSLSIINAGILDVSGSDANNTVTVDGSGGGGAGGSILVNSNSGQSNITAYAFGGDGGSNNPNSQGGASQHGPGGSGGGGVIYSNGTLNAASAVTGGQAGYSTGPFKPGDPVSTTHYGADSILHNGVIVQTFPSSQLPPKMTICQTTVLPVTLIDFNANYQGSNTVEVDWSTSREINANYFEIERSTNAINFTTAGQVSASQSTNDIHNYTFNDYIGAISSVVYYYRLKIVDVNGSYTYSKIVSVRLSQSETKISLYPNPASDFAVLNLYAEKQGTAIMRLIDNAGRQIMTKSFNLNAGSNSLMIDQLTHLAKGIYMVQLVYNDNIYNQKLVKQ
ncbi:MAG TPA: T9SS type A sorting domain-containing protein, partial [Puia sp.]|nr:T9SS type A sorting domain-containing protein [Puia sp.]